MCTECISTLAGDVFTTYIMQMFGMVQLCWPCIQEIHGLNLSQLTSQGQCLFPI